MVAKGIRPLAKQALPSGGVHEEGRGRLRTETLDMGKLFGFLVAHSLLSSVLGI